VVDATPKGSFTSALFVQMVADTFIHELRVVRGVQGWVVLVIDTGGGHHGMHLSMEFALLMWRHEASYIRVIYLSAVLINARILIAASFFDSTQP
jgi:hypothetical protein